MSVLRRKSIQSVTDAIQTSLRNAIEEALEAEDCPADRELDAQGCQRARELMGLFTLEVMDLQKGGLGGSPYDFLSIRQLGLGFLDIGDEINRMVEGGSDLEECKSGHADGCRVSQVKIKPLIDLVLSRQVTLVSGLCLTCFEVYGDSGIQHEPCTHVRYPERSW